jgi:hypothetical protein
MHPGQPGALADRPRPNQRAMCDPHPPAGTNPPLPTPTDRLEPTHFPLSCARPPMLPWFLLGPLASLTSTTPMVATHPCSDFHGRDPPLLRFPCSLALVASLVRSSSAAEEQGRSISPPLPGEEAEADAHAGDELQPTADTEIQPTADRSSPRRLLPALVSPPHVRSNCSG